VRSPHYVKRNSRNETPWEAIWVDTETNQEPTRPGEVKHRLWYGWAAHRRRKAGQVWTRPDWHRFVSPLEFWEWTFSHLHGRARLYVFCHNGAFDYPVLDSFRILPELGWKLTKAIIDSPPIILAWRRGQQTILMLDTLNIWKMPLAKLGLQVGLGKLKMPKRTASPARWDAYCRRDVKVIMRACLSWFDFLTTNDLGGFAPTEASQAMRTFRHRFMSHPIYIDDHPKALALARDSYLGGRTECFQVGRVEGPIHVLDVNGMYPAVMRSTPMPAKLIAYTERATPDDLAEWLVDRCVVAEVFIRTERPMYPVVFGGRLCFPTGVFPCVLSSPELERAVIAGEVVSVRRAAVYERAVLFRDFVEWFWSFRRAAQERGDKVADAQGKKLPQAFYGKWGQRGRVYDVVGEDTDPNPRTWVEYDVDTGTRTKYRSLAGSIQQFKDEGEARESSPAIASHVTSGGRLQIADLIHVARRENVYYTDTDSLWCNQVAFDRLQAYIQPTQLGGLKIERTEPWAIFYGPKDYETPSIARTKGVSKEPYWNANGEIVQDQWSSLVGLVALGDLSAPRTTMVAKNLERVYRKGVVGPDGRVTPFVLPCDPPEEGKFKGRYPPRAVVA
jgi:hypothetical protein